MPYEIESEEWDEERKQRAMEQYIEDSADDPEHEIEYPDEDSQGKKLSL